VVGRLCLQIMRSSKMDDLNRSYALLLVAACQGTVYGVVEVSCRQIDEGEDRSQVVEL